MEDSLVLFHVEQHIRLILLFLLPLNNAVFNGLVDFVLDFLNMVGQIDEVVQLLGIFLFGSVVELQKLAIEPPPTLLVFLPGDELFVLRHTVLFQVFQVPVISRDSLFDEVEMILTRWDRLFRGEWDRERLGAYLLWRLREFLRVFYLWLSLEVLDIFDDPYGRALNLEEHPLVDQQAAREGAADSCLLFALFCCLRRSLILFWLEGSDGPALGLGALGKLALGGDWPGG